MRFTPVESSRVPGRIRHGYSRGQLPRGLGCLYLKIEPQLWGQGAGPLIYIIYYPYHASLAGVVPGMIQHSQWKCPAHAMIVPGRRFRLPWIISVWVYV